MTHIFKTISKVAVVALVVFQSLPALAATYSSTNYQVVDPAIQMGGGRSTSTTYQLIGTIGETAVGLSTSASFTETAGSLGYPRCTSPVLTAATAGTGTIALSWTAATCSGGWTFSSYQYCKGTAADTYTTCSSAGSSLSATDTATPGVLTYYRIRVIATGAASSGSPAGNVGSRSNEYPITPSVGGGGGGGGGGGSSTVTTTVSLTAPNGGESLQSGSAYAITWSSTGNNISSMALLLSSDAGLSFPTTIATGETNDGTYTWTVPNMTGSRFRVRLEARNSTGGVLYSDLSNSNFSIGPAGAIPEPEPEVPATTTSQAPKSSDVNTDGGINLTDFSFLLAWYKKADPPANYDLNRDGIVNLRDISILIYNWTA